MNSGTVELPMFSLSNALTYKLNHPHHSLLRNLRLRIIIKTDFDPVFKIIRLLET